MEFEEEFSVTTRRVEKMIEKMRRGLKRDLEKVRRRLRKKPCYLPSASFLFLFYILNFILFPIVLILYE